MDLGVEEGSEGRAMGSEVEEGEEGTVVEEEGGRCRLEEDLFDEEPSEVRLGGGVRVTSEVLEGGGVEAGVPLGGVEVRGGGEFRFRFVELVARRQIPFPSRLFLFKSLVVGSDH